MRITAVTCVKNEGAFLLEWLAHHKGVGITDFLIFSNDCDDGTEAMLDRLDALGEITHIRNPGPHEGGVQFTAFKQADKHPLVTGADWLITLDLDEFINIHVGDHTLGALFAALPEADAITLTWRMFGNCGIRDFTDAPVTEQFTRAAPETLPWPWRAFMFKTLYRNSGAYKKLGVHRPRSPSEAADNAHWYDGAGRALEPDYRRQKIFSNYTRPNYALVQLNHYALGAMESFIVKRDRGQPTHRDHLLGLDYWTERNWCDVEDSSIRASDPLRDAELARLKTDPTLARLHDEAALWRKARFVALMQDEPNRALFGRLMLAPPARVISPQDAAHLYAYARAASPDQT